MQSACICVPPCWPECWDGMFAAMFAMHSTMLTQSGAHMLAEKINRSVRRGRSS